MLMKYIFFVVALLMLNGIVISQTQDAIPPVILTRLLQLEDERNYNASELTKLLKNTSPAIRGRVALTIGRIGDKKGTDSLIALLGDKNATVKAWAVFALGEMEDPKAVKPLATLMSGTPESNSESYIVVGNTIEALGKILGIQNNVEIVGTENVNAIGAAIIRNMEHYQASGKKKPVLLALTALARMRFKPAIDPMTKLTSSEEGDIRYIAEKGLARINRPYEAKGAVSRPPDETSSAGHDKAYYDRLVKLTDKKVSAVIHTSKGKIAFEFFPKDAPITSDNFITLAQKGYFNGQTFHRVVSNFVIQGGDPNGDGEGGPGYQIRCEINTRP